METNELLRKVRRIEIKSRRLSRHFFSGDYASAFKGRGMSFSEVRAYQYGDEVRNIDWNVTARTGDPYVKVFEEERELSILLAVDISSSVFFGTATPWKQEWIAEVAAVLGFSAIQNNDKAGLLLFSDKVEMYIPPRKGKSQLLRIIRELLYARPAAQATDVRPALAFLSRILKQRSIVFVFSDFMSPSFEEALKIAGKRHEMIGVHMIDPAEVRFPKVGLVRLADPETGRTHLLDAGDTDVRRILQDHHLALTETARAQFVRAHCGWLSLQTDQSYIPALHRFFKLRASS